MKITAKELYGFSLTNSTYVKEVDATLYDLTHDKSGARLILLDRADENTTFTISNISWRRTNEFVYRNLICIFTHVKSNQ